MTKSALERKCEIVYREVAKNVLDKIKLQMEAYIGYIHIQGYDTQDNLRRTLTTVINKGYSEFEIEFAKKINERFNENERRVLEKHIQLYHITVKKTFNEFVDFVMNMML